MTTTALTLASVRPVLSRRTLVAAVRILFGLAFVVFGLNGFVEFLPRPTTPPAQGAMSFAMAMFQTGYLFQLVKGTELLAGLLILTGRLTPLGLVLLAPVLVNIVAFHAFLEPSGLAFVCFLVAIEIGLAWAYRQAFKPILGIRA